MSLKGIHIIKLIWKENEYLKVLLKICLDLPCNKTPSISNGWLICEMRFYLKKKIEKFITLKTYVVYTHVICHLKICKKLYKKLLVEKNMQF